METPRFGYIFAQCIPHYLDADRCIPKNVTVRLLLGGLSVCNLRQLVHDHGALSVAIFLQTTLESDTPLILLAGLGKVILDLGLEVSVKFSRPITIGERVELCLESCNAVALDLTFMDATPVVEDSNPSTPAAELQYSHQEPYSATVAAETSAFAATLPHVLQQQTTARQL